MYMYSLSLSLSLSLTRSLTLSHLANDQAIYSIFKTESEQVDDLRMIINVSSYIYMHVY